MGLIAIEWVQEYHGRLGNPVNTKANAEGFYNTLTATQKFAYGDDAAQDKHFEQSGVGNPPAGSDTEKGRNGRHDLLRRPRRLARV